MPISNPASILVEAGIPPSKISNMTAAAALTGAELVPLVQGGLNVRSTASAIAGLSASNAILVESGVGAKISALPASAALTGTEQIPVNQGGTTVRTTTLAVAALATPAAPPNSLQFNNAGVFGGSANAVFDGVNKITAHTLTVSTGDLTVTPGSITTGAATNIDLKTSGGTQFRVKHSAGATNFLQAYGFTGGGAAGVLEAVGASADVQIAYASKGTQGHFFLTNGIGGATMFAVVHNTTNSDYLTAYGGSGNTHLQTAGSSANIAINLTVKGGNHFFVWRNTPNSGIPLFELNNPGTVAQNLTVNPGSTGQDLSLVVGGSDAVRNMRLSPVGTTGSVYVQEFGATVPSVKFIATVGGVSPNNFLQFTPSLATNPLLIEAQGSGVNVGIQIKPLGTGNVIFEPGTGTTLTVATATATTLNLYNTVATTLNIGSAATAARIGATSGTLTIGNPTVVGTQTTQNVFNTVATTVNFAGAADVNISVAGKTTTVAGSLTVTQDILANGGSNAFAGSVDITGALTASGASQINNTLFVTGEIESTAGLVTGQNAFLVKSSVAMTDGAAAQVGTLTNAPAAGNPTKWIPIDDNGATRYIPAW